MNTRFFGEMTLFRVSYLILVSGASYDVNEIRHERGVLAWCGDVGVVLLYKGDDGAIRAVMYLCLVR